MKLLVVSHTGAMSGAEIATLRQLRAMPSHVRVTGAVPAGPFADALRSAGVPVLEIPGTRGSLKLHPVHTSRAVLDLGRSAVRIARPLAHSRPDAILAVTPRATLALAGLPGLPRTVTSVQDALPPGRVTALVRRVVDAASDALVANSAYTAARLRALGFSTPTSIVHLPVDLEAFGSADAAAAAAFRTQAGAGRDALLIGVVAQITPWKGQDTLVEAMPKIVAAVPQARLVLVGQTTFTAAATRFDNRRYLDDLRDRVAALGLTEHVVFAGPRTDMPAVMRGLDVLAAPSWEEPFGLSIAEAMAAGTPVAATAVGGPPEFVPSSAGVLVAPRDPEAWAGALTDLLADTGRRARLGAGAREAAAALIPAVSAERLLAVLEDRQPGAAVDA